MVDAVVKLRRSERGPAVAELGQRPTDNIGVVIDSGPALTLLRARTDPGVGALSRSYAKNLEHHTARPTIACSFRRGSMEAG